jgi:hypothetical protein
LIISELIGAKQGNFSFQKINNKVGDSQKRWKPLKKGGALGRMATA